MEKIEGLIYFRQNQGLGAAKNFLREKVAFIYFPKHVG